MEPANVFLIFTERLEHAGIRYMSTGSVASMLYGIPRFTHDLDLVIELGPHQVSAITNAFPSDLFYAPPEEVIQVERHRPQRGHFNIIHHATGLKADIYIHGRDPLHSWGLANKNRIEQPDGKGIWVAPPEYVIIRKLEYYREGHSEKHIHDIAGMLEISGDIIKQDIIKEWVARLDLQKQWSKATQKS
jgi:hypothetical protein